MSALHFDAVGQMQPVSPNGSLFHQRNGSQVPPKLRARDTVSGVENDDLEDL